VRALYVVTLSLVPACGGGDKFACDEGYAVDAAGECRPVTPGRIEGVSIGPEQVRTQDTLQATVIISGEVVEQGLPYADYPVRYRWFVDEVEAMGTADHLHGWKYFVRGELVRLLVEPLEGGEGEWSNSIVIANTPPPAPGINLYPEAPIAGVDTLRCAVTGVGDFDGDDISYRIDWTRDGEPWAALPPPPDDGGDPPGWDTGELPPEPPPVPSEVPAGTITAGEEWSCHVSAFDGTDWSRIVTASVAIQESIAD
jgi:hypothetical protein